MWDSCRLLNFVSNVLFMLVAAAVIGAFAQYYGLPRFLPLKTVQIHKMQPAHSAFKHITREQIEQIVKHDVYGNFLSVNLISVRDAFVRLPWVRQAKVERVWPLGLKISIEEQQALAHWGSHALVNTYGEVFRASSDKRMPVFRAPMEANAQEVTRNYRRFSTMLSPLNQSISAIRLSSRRAWQIRLNSGTLLELGRQEIEKRLLRYVSIYDHSIAHLNQDEPLAYVDLRYPSGFAVSLPKAGDSLKDKRNTNKET